MAKNIFLFLLATFITFVGVSQEFVFPKRLAAEVDPVFIPVSVGDNINVPSSDNGIYTDVNIRDYITLGINHDFVLFTSVDYNLEVDLTINPTNGTAFPISLVIDFKAFKVQDYQDKDTYVFNGYDEYSITIDQIRVDGVVVNDLPGNAYVEGEIKLRRYFDFTQNGADEIDGLNSTLVDENSDNEFDAIAIDWLTESGALEYQLEWTFVNNYYAVVDASSSTYSQLQESELDYNFRNNSTRITTRETGYIIPLLFESGYLLYRVRAVGEDPSQPGKFIYGSWGTSDNGKVSFLPSNQKQLIDEHEARKNWQVTTTFAEEGKKKEVASYYDGSLRNRQSVTVVNTDDNVIVGETVYDHQGRPAVNILPVPVINDSIIANGNKNVLKYYPDFNKNNTGEAYNRTNFDVDAGNCNNNIQNTPSTSGASRYYSPNNPLQINEQSYIPDAENYPFTVVEYTPDNTGRIRRQSGVGPEFQLGTGHESRYFYGKPDQIQIDRLFGSEVGYSKHHKKNMVIDPNGQISVSYLDQEGRVIATSLAGDNPNNVSAIESHANAEVSLSQQMIEADENNLTPLGNINQMQFSQSLLVSSADDYTFTYDMSVDHFSDSCMVSGICFSCVYDLSISITDDCGNIISGTIDGVSNTPALINKLNGQLNPVNGGYQFVTDCNVPTYSGGHTLVLPLEVGNYNLVKTLTVNEDAAEFYLNEYLDSANNLCFKTLYDFQAEYLAEIDTTACYIDCEVCASNLGSRDEFIANGGGSGDDYDALLKECLEPCETPTMCQMSYEMMLTDVSPGGQYGKYLDNNGNINSSMYPLSVFNELNYLNGISTNWRNPSVMLNGVLETEYLNEDGTISLIEVIDLGGGNYSPAINVPAPGSNNGVLLVRPHQLANYADFVDVYWKDSWAKSLVRYHPEYCYYEECQKYEIENSAGVSSESFDASLRGSTFETAVADGWIISDPSNPNEYIFNITDFNDPFLDPSYLTNLTSSGSSGVNSNQLSIAQVNLINALSGNYKQIGGTWYSILEFAALINNCGANLNGINSIPLLCTEFGANTSTQDAEWVTVIALYLSMKDEIVNGFYDQAVLADFCINDCIGNSDFNPFAINQSNVGSSGNPFSTSSYNNTGDEPCSNQRRWLYVNKQKRFPDRNELEYDANQAAYQLYELTGQCPVAYNLQNVLSQMASSGNLQGNHLLNDYSGFSGLFLAVSPNDNSPVPVTDLVLTSSDPALLKFDMTFGSNNCEFSLQTDGTPVIWSDVFNISGLQATQDLGNGLYEFNANASVSVTNNNITTIENITLTGTTCFNVLDCEFENVCEPTDLAREIEILFSFLAAEGHIATAKSIGADANYLPLTNGLLSNYLFPLNSINWNFNGGSSSLSSNIGEINFDFTGVDFDPGFSISDIYYLDNFNGDFQNFFVSNLYDVNNVKIGSVNGAVTYVPASGVSESLSLGLCSSPESIGCAGQEYENIVALESLLEGILVNNEVSLVNNSILTSQLSQYFPNLSGNNNVQVLSNEITIYDDLSEESSCGLSLAVASGYDFLTMDIQQLLSVQVDGDISNNAYNDFVVLVRIADGSGGFENVEIYGTSCIPIKNCEVCDEETVSPSAEKSIVITDMNIVSNYSKMITTIDETNAKEGYTESDTGNFITSPKLEKCLVNGDEVYFNEYTRYVSQFNGNYEDSTLLMNFEEFKRTYGTSLNVQYELDKYKKITEACNAALDSNNQMTCVCDSTFTTGIYAEMVGEYAKYVDSVLTEGDSTIEDIITFSENKNLVVSNASISCKDLYVNYINAYNVFWPQYGAASNVSGYEFTSCKFKNPIISFTEFEKICESPCSGALNDYVNSFNDFTTCPKLVDFNPSVVITCNKLTCDTVESCFVSERPILIKCDAQYAMYRDLVNLFNRSDYAGGKGFKLEERDYSNEFCECYESYINYLFPYLLEDKISTLPLPDNIDSFNCLVSPCSELVSKLNNEIDIYNSSYYASVFNAPLPLVDALEVEDCSCIESYIKCLNVYTSIKIDALFKYNLPTPLPYNESNCGNCCGGELVEDEKGNISCKEITSPCDDVYQEYVLVSNAYNLDYPLANPIKILSKKDFISNGLCSCGHEFANYIQSILDGTTPEPTNEMPTIFDLVDFCAPTPCGPEEILNNDLYTATVPYTNPCVENMLNIAYSNAANAYEEYISELSGDFLARYKNHCKEHLNESFTKDYAMREHHYTLYYYDQAGNLVKTIPPEGVDILPITSSLDPLSIAISNDRANSQHTIFTNHRLPTLYHYNSLNQLTKQSLPDHDKMDVLDYTLVNGLDANLRIAEVDFVNDNYGFLTGTKNVTLADGVTVVDRGYVYTTTDAGQTWNKMNDLVASDINAIQWVNNNLAFAVANDGVLIRSVDGGSSWDVVDLYASEVTNNLTDLLLDANGDGLIVGENMTIISYTNGLSPMVSVISPITTASGLYAFDPLDDITSIAFDSTNYFIGVEKYNAGNTFGAIYQSSDGINWTAVENNSVSQLNDVQILSSSEMVAVGNNGLLISSNDAGDNWFVKKTNAAENIEHIYFHTSDIAVAVINQSLYKTVDGGKTFDLLDNSKSYISLNGFDKITYSGSQISYALATCDNGELVKVSANDNGFVAMEAETIYGGNSNVNVSSWAVTQSTGNQNNSTTLPVIAVNDIGSVLFTKNLNVSSPVWTDVTPNIVFGGLTDVRFVQVGSQLNGVLQTNVGLLYYFELNPNSNVISTFTQIGGVTDNYSSIDLRASGEIVAYNSTQDRLEEFDLNNGGANSIGLGLSSAINSNLPTVIVTLPTGEIHMIQQNGAIFKLETSEVAQTLNIRSQRVNDIAVIGANTMAVTDAGDVVSISGNQGAVVSSTSSEDLNAITERSITETFIVGDNGTAFNYNGTTFSNQNIGTTEDLLSTDYDATCNCAIIGGANGTKVYYNGSTYQALNNPGAQDLNAAAVDPNGNYLLAGNSSHLYQGVGNFVMKNNNVFVSSLLDISFNDVNHGIISGDHFVARRTINGGNNWVNIKPNFSLTPLTSFDGAYRDAKEYAGQTILAGAQGFYANVVQASNEIGAAQTSSGYSSSRTIYDVVINSNGIGYMVGGAGSAGNGFIATSQNGGNSWTQVASGIETQYNTHAFEHNNTFVSVGNNGSMPFYNGTGVVNFTTGTTETLLDVDFYDDAIGYAVGNEGTILKTNTYTWNNPTDRVLTILGMTSIPLSDDTGTQTTDIEKDIKTISAQNRSNIFIGGRYDAASSDQVYARLLQDEAEEFSTYFYYDKLGRIVASQNSRQFAETPKKYSYTLYDALGRVVEAGEKTENASLAFNTIFGTQISNYFNPSVVDDTKLNNWINETGARREVTHSYYDNLVTDFTLPSTFTQNEDNLRKRIGSVTYEELYDGDDATYNYATHYDYDIHGNVKTLIQDNKDLGININPDIAEMQFKRMDYSYDLISGNVHEVSYQDGEADQWHHRYEYDGDNRILNVETSDDKLLWDQDARYFYYDHGPLARVELGENNVQGLDYAYTLQGWLKGVNSDLLDPNNDIGKDGSIPTSGINPNQMIARDAHGFSLNYFAGDYQPINAGVNTSATSFNSTIQNSDVATNRNDLYNGNIGAMVTTLKKPLELCDLVQSASLVYPQATAYQYDQLNRLLEARAFTNIQTDNSQSGFNEWGTGTVDADSRYFNKFSYDANGNIKSQIRKDEDGNLIDQLSYNYAKDGNGKIVQNRLYGVNDVVDYDDKDIDDMGQFVSALDKVNNGKYNIANPLDSGNNYKYDATGQLIQDHQEEIERIVWRVDGKISAIIRAEGSLKTNLIFDYDPMGNRIAKHVYGNEDNTAATPFDINNPSPWKNSTYYNRDAQGNVMAIYEYKVDDVNSLTNYTLAERNIYGSSRVGMNINEVEMISSASTTDHIYNYIGKRQYELSNHLGNVLSVITDRKFARDDNNDDLVDYYEPDVVLTYDYSPFGVTLPERSFVKQVAHDETFEEVNYLIQDDFEDGTTQGWVAIVSGESVLTNSNGQLAVTKSGGTNLGVAKSFNTISGYHYYFSCTVDANSCDPWIKVAGNDNDIKISIYEINNPNVPIYTALQDYSNGFFIFDFVAPTTATYMVQFERVGNNSNCTFLVDNVNLREEYETTICVFEDYTDYRYGFNGMEKDDEVKGQGNSYNYKARMYDNRLGRFLSIDPLASNYPWYTPYQFAGNMPIAAIDMDGKEEYVVIKWVDNKQLRGVIVLRYTKSSQAKQLVENKYLSTVNYYTQMVKDSKTRPYTSKKGLKANEKITADLQAKLSDAKAEYENKLGEQNNVVDENYNQVLYVTIECIDDECSEVKDLEKNAKYYLKNFDEVTTLGKYDGIQTDYQSSFDEGDALMMDKGVSDAFQAFQEGKDHGAEFANHVKKDIDHYLTVPISSEAKTNFATGSYELSDEIKTSIKNSVYRNMLYRPSMKVEVVGHTDIQGSSESNKVLSEQRAEAVVQYLIELGISSDRLSSSGKGGDSPLGGSDADDRRVEFVQQ